MTQRDDERTSAAPRVSVIVPVYDSMPYLTETMASILAQDLASGELEVIAIDDGSTDGSGAELDRWAARDARVEVIHQPNSGWPGMPRNRGIERARGEYLFFMDSDDTIAPSALRLMVEMADADGAEVVIPRMRGTNGRKMQQLFDKHPHGPITVARAMETISPQKLFRRDFVERHGLRFPEGRVRLEDGMFVSRAYALARRIDFCAPEPLYFIAERSDGQNISARTIDPEGYVQSVRTIMEILREHTPDAAAADRLVLEFFTRKGLRFYAPKRWLASDDAERAAWVRLHRELLQDQVPERLDAGVRTGRDRQLIGLIRAGDTAAVDAAVRLRASLRHRPRLASLSRSGAGWELLVEVSPAERPSDPRLAALPDAPLQRVPPGRLRAAERLHGALRRFSRLRPVRGAGRRLEQALAGERPRLALHLVGRVDARRTVVPARWAGTTGGDDPRYRFVLSAAMLRRYAGQRVDLYTVRAGEQGEEGIPERVGPAGSYRPGSVARVRGYVTNAGFVSLVVPKKL